MTLIVGFKNIFNLETFLQNNILQNVAEFVFLGYKVIPGIKQLSNPSNSRCKVIK